MANERITEDYVRSHFKRDPLFRDIKLEEQQTTNKRIKERLKHAAKTGSGKPGYPEFIITFPSVMDSIIIVECKSKLQDHERKSDDEPQNPEKYAVDGVLHYAKYLTDEFNVIALAVSGEKKDDLQISNFILKKGESTIQQTSDNKLLILYDYLNIFEKTEVANKLKDQNLILFASDLNQTLYDYSVPEIERATIVSGILIGLQNKSFRKSYQIDKAPSQLVEDLLKAIERVLESNGMGGKTKILLGEYGKISQSNKLAISEYIRDNETGKDEKNTLLRDIIHELDVKVFPFTEYKHIGYDILGQFYSEFIRYVYGDKKLGLVLTPQHITELFVDIARPNVDSVVYDNCCGTAGFLIKAMKRLIELAGNDEAKKKHIREKQLIGVEERSDMFTYACSNMMMRGDGKSNIFQGDSLSERVKDKIKAFKPTVGLLNPPYSTSVSELEFIYHNLDCLDSGVCVAIIPMSCVLAQSGINYQWKKKLLEKHTLDAVFSMPDDLFYPTGTVTAIVVFRVKTKHPDNYETYFGYWKDDGFIKTKNVGRIDYHGRWEEIKQYWTYNYHNRREIKQHSVKRHVTEDDEWCAEAYMETDYSLVTPSVFETTVQDYVLFRLRNGIE